MSVLKEKAISGFKWVAFSRYAQKGLSFVTFIILARLLEPEVFGLFAMAFIVIDGLGLFKNLGVDAALVQRRDNVEMASHTAFWMMPFMGVIIFAILYLIAPLASFVLREPELTVVVRALGIIFMLGAMENIPASLLNKELQFKELAIRELVSAVLFSISAVVFAILGYGVWSLVYAYLIRRTSMFFFSWGLSTYRPKWQFDRKIAVEMLHFGKFIFGASIMGFLIMNTDNFLVGRLMGAAALGYYALAYNLSTLTTTHLSALIHRVMFPTYAKIQDDHGEVKKISLKIMKTLSLIAFPFGIGVVLYAAEIIEFIYGAKWLPLVPALLALIPCTMLLPIASVKEAVFTGCGKPKWSFLLHIPIVVLMFILIPLLSHLWGLLGVGVAVSISKLSMVPVAIILMKRLIDLGFDDLFKTLKPILGASLLMVTTGIIMKLTLIDVLGKYTFILHGIVVTGVYLLSVHRLDSNIFVDLKGKLFKIQSKKLKLKEPVVTEIH